MRGYTTKENAKMAARAVAALVTVECAVVLALALLASDVSEKFALDYFF
jgi:hypothetical protein